MCGVYQQQQVYVPGLLMTPVFFCTVVVRVPSSDSYACIFDRHMHMTYDIQKLSDAMHRGHYCLLNTVTAVQYYQSRTVVRSTVHMDTYVLPKANRLLVYRSMILSIELSTTGRVLVLRRVDDTEYNYCMTYKARPPQKVRPSNGCRNGSCNNTYRQLLYASLELPKCLSSAIHS